MINTGKPIFIDKKIISSKAFFALKVHGLRVLFVFFTKRKLGSHRDSKGNQNWHILNNGEITFTYKEAEKKGMSKKQFRDALDDLIAKGFLEVSHQGVGQGDSSTYKLIDNWADYGKKDFKPGPERRKNISTSRGWNIYNNRKNNN